MATDRVLDGGGAAGGRVSARVGLRRPVSRGRQGGVRPKQGKTLEKYIVDGILKYLNGLVGCYAKKKHGSQFNPGWPDIIGCYAGRAFFIEVKQPGNEPTALQAEELKRWGQAKARTLVAYSVDDVVTFMNGYHDATKGARG